MKTLYAVAGLLLVAAPAMAQGGGMGRMGPPADHWMTFDSLVAAVGITDAQKADAQKHYDAINDILKQAAERRPPKPGPDRRPPPPEQRHLKRSILQQTRTDTETHHNQVRGVLTSAHTGEL